MSDGYRMLTPAGYTTLKDGKRLLGNVGDSCCCGTQNRKVHWCHDDSLIGIITQAEADTYGPTFQLNDLCYYVGDQTTDEPTITMTGAEQFDNCEDCEAEYPTHTCVKCGNCCFSKSSYFDLTNLPRVIEGPDYDSLPSDIKNLYDLAIPKINTKLAETTKLYWDDDKGYWFSYDYLDPDEWTSITIQKNCETNTWSLYIQGASYYGMLDITIDTIGTSACCGLGEVVLKVIADDGAFGTDYVCLDSYTAIDIPLRNNRCCKDSEDDCVPIPTANCEEIEDSTDCDPLP